MTCRYKTLKHALGICYLFENTSKYDCYDKTFQFDNDNENNTCTITPPEGWELKGDPPGEFEEKKEKNWDDTDRISTGYKFYLRAGEDKFVEYVRSDKTSTVEFPYTLNEREFEVNRKYHPLTPLIVVPTSKEVSIFELSLSKFKKCNEGFKKTEYVCVDFNDFKKEKYVDEYYCVLFAILDDDIAATDLDEMKGFFNYYGATAPCVAWVFSKGMSFKLRDSIKEHHKFFEYKKSTELKKAKRLLQAVEWLRETHDTKMKEEVVANFNKLNPNKEKCDKDHVLEKNMESPYLHKGDSNKIDCRICKQT